MTGHVIGQVMGQVMGQVTGQVMGQVTGLGGGSRDLEKREVGKKMKNRPWIVT